MLRARSLIWRVKEKAERAESSDQNLGDSSSLPLPQQTTLMSDVARLASSEKTLKKKKHRRSKKSSTCKERAFTKIKTLELPEDIIFEIFSWLPVKSICKFKSCSKSIYEFTQETYFALKQSQNSVLKDDYCFFIQQKIFRWNHIKTEVHALPGEKASSGVPANFVESLNETSARIIASSNGLLLCQIGRKSTPKTQLFICNPTTQSCSFIATPHRLLRNPDAFVTFAFECNYSRGVDCEDYKLFLFESNSNEESSSFGCKIYMPKEGVWKEREKSFFVDDGNVKLDLPVVFHKGDVYFASSWPISNGIMISHIASYTLESGISRMLKVPEEAIETAQRLMYYEYEIGIFKWGKAGSSNESICLVTMVKKFVFTIWVLTHYESSSWSKVLTLSLNDMGLGKKNSTVLGFTVMNGDSLVFGTTKNVFRYDLIGKRRKRLEKICEHGFEYDLCFTPHSNTLRPCGTGARALPLPP